MPNDTALWQRAASFAARAHRHQTRKDGVTPYVAHVFRVAFTVRDAFGCDDRTALAAALLHDTIEDTGADYDELADEFGRKVASCVAALTKNMALPERERELEYDRRLARADWRARLVKLADTFDNLTDAMERTSGRKEALKKSIKKCRRALALARPDARTRPETRAAIKAVTLLITRRRARSTKRG
jgi:guanosine-3',5'-bis(diphosphate) 3'-pyrophosphohydrolase